MPDFSNVFNTVASLTVSTALAMSKKTPPVSRLLSIACFELSVISKMACSFDLSFLKPNWH